MIVDEVLLDPPREVKSRRRCFLDVLTWQRSHPALLGDPQVPPDAELSTCKD